jgi:hypothetical protein
MESGRILMNKFQIRVLGTKQNLVASHVEDSQVDLAGAIFIFEQRLDELPVYHEKFEGLRFEVVKIT